MKPFPRAEISLSALTHNLQQLKQLAPGSKVMAVVKANAYGHGLLHVARHLDGAADGFGLARLEEALELRHGGIQGKLMLLEGFFRPDDLHKLVAHHIDTVVHHESQLEMLEQVTLDEPVNVWLKIDSGMHRLGFTPEQFSAVYERLGRCPNVAKPINLITHFSRADEPDEDYTSVQLAIFDALTSDLPGERSLAASAGALFWPQSQRDWIRPGIAIYGVSPVTGDLGINHALIPAMELKSQLIAVRDHKTGEPVGYGGYWHAGRDTRLGVVAIGYGDGYPRNAPEGTPVWVNGRRVPVVGRVSMDMLTVDLGPGATDKAGDDVLLWGQALHIEEVAEHIGTISYELMTKLTPRVAVCVE
ncbi:alanine racemase [Shewanella sp. NFH-SH190041]|uniref:alanine racemase n=1 Tax=Shewanella sp. NFH-SH190041 TaxID=2950245 RepID=UPI0021C32D01|nr:alanine racemase [Shewanella sp. NFH-SH190041]BDM65810.1 alanine racemase [Shewanella sp. NFH-SH190041]